MPEIIVSFAGQPGSGKTTAVSLLECRFGFTGIRPSRVIRSYAQEHDITLGVDRSLWAEMRRRIGEERGPDWLTQAIFTSPAQAVALDGLRAVGDYNVLNRARQNELARVAFVGLVCPPEIRYRNIITSEDFDKVRPNTLEAFLAQEIPEYYSEEGEYGVATQTVLDLTQPELRVEYTTEPKEVVGQMFVSRLTQFGYLNAT